MSVNAKFSWRLLDFFVERFILLDLYVCERVGKSVNGGALLVVDGGCIGFVGDVCLCRRHSNTKFGDKGRSSGCAKMCAVQTQVKWWQEQTRSVFWERDGLIAFTTDLQAEPSRPSYRKSLGN